MKRTLGDFAVADSPEFKVKSRRTSRKTLRLLGRMEFTSYFLLKILGLNQSVEESKGGVVMALGLDNDAFGELSVASAIGPPKYVFYQGSGKAASNIIFLFASRRSI